MNDCSYTEETSLMSSFIFCVPPCFPLFPLLPFLSFDYKFMFMDFILSIYILNYSLERGRTLSGPFVNAFTIISSHALLPCSRPSLSYIYFLSTSMTISWSPISLLSCSISLLLLCYFDNPYIDAFYFFNIWIELRRVFTLSACIFEIATL